MEILKKRMQKTRIITGLIGVSAGIYGAFFSQPANEHSWITVLLTIVMVLIVLIIGFYRSNKKQNEMLNKYELIISEQTITRKQPVLPDISIEFKDIQSIKKNKKGVFIIQGRSFDRIYIPPQIENYEQLEQSLNRIKSIEEYTIKPINRKLLWTCLSLIVIIIAAAFITFNSVLLYLAVTVVMGYFLWALIYAGLRKIISRSYVIIGCLVFINLYVLIMMRIYDKDHPAAFQLNQSGKVSGLLDSTSLTFPEYDTLKENRYKANGETEWVIDLYCLDKTVITNKDLQKIFDKEWEEVYPSYLYGFSNMEKKWILTYAADSLDTFDSLQVGVSLINTYIGKNTNAGPALLDNYVHALNARMEGYPAKLKLVTKESSAMAMQRAQVLVSIYNTFNKEASVSLQTKKGFRGNEVWQVLQRAGLNWNSDYLFEWTNNSASGGYNHFIVETSTDPGYFSQELNEKGMRPKNLIFKFSIPRSVDPEHVFDNMIRTALYCQSELGGELVNVYMQPLDTSAERRSITTIVKQLKQQGVVPGSEKALEIF